jgi:uridine kinase
MHVILVAIAGGSASGKSWLAERLRERLGARALRLSLDQFYRDLSHLPPGRRARVNFDHPRAVDWPAFVAALRALRAGRPARAPEYDFATHCRVGPPRRLAPRPCVLVDGLWPWRRPALRPLYALKVFLECPPETQLRRRLRRDVQERGRDPRSVRRQFREHVLPMQERFVTPQRRRADLVLRSPVSRATLAQLEARIREHLFPSKDRRAPAANIV